MTGDALPPEAAAAEPAGPRVVLFDFDGVLIHGDSFGLFVRHLYATPWRRLLFLLSLPLLLVLLPFSRWLVIRWLVGIALLGLDERRYMAEAEAFAASLARRPKQFCRDGLQALRRHQAAGDRVLVVTGCEHTLVSGILRELGLSDLEVLASRFRPGGLGMRVLRHNVGRNKVLTLGEHGLTEWDVAYGDSMYDVAMMKVAVEPVLVNGTPALCKKVEKILGRPVTRVAWH